MKNSLILLSLLFAQFTHAQPSKNKDYFIDIAEGYLAKAEKNLSKDSSLFHTYIDSTLAISIPKNLTDITCKAIIDRGVFNYNTGKYQTSISDYIAALKVIKNKDRKSLEAKIYDNIGLVNYAMQNHQKAIGNSLKALKINKQIKDSANLIRNHNNLGINYYMLKDYAKAAFHYRSSKELSDVIGDTRGVITGLSNLALVKEEQKDFEGAQAYYLKSLEYSRELDDPLTTAYVLVNLGGNYTKLDQPEKSILALKEAQQLAKKNNILEVQKYCHLYLGDAYAKKGDYKRSFKERQLYDALKDSLLTLEKEIGIAEIETKYNSEKNQEKIDSQGSEIDSYSKQAKWLFLFLSIILVTLGVLVFKYNKNQKQFKQEKNYIDRQYKEVEHKNQELKFSLLQISNQLEADRNSESKLIKYKKSSLSSTQREVYVKKMLDYMQEKKPYLNSEITPQEIATDLNMNKHHLSEILNINFGKNFNSFINLYRVEKAKEILINDTENLTMLAVAFDSGFNSKSSFNRAFKESTGFTPTHFKEQRTKSV